LRRGERGVLEARWVWSAMHAGTDAMRKKRGPQKTPPYHAHQRE
jgi:hypothetical protein